MISSYSQMQTMTDRRDATPCQACQMSGSRKTFPACYAKSSIIKSAATTASASETAFSLKSLSFKTI